MQLGLFEEAATALDEVDEVDEVDVGRWVAPPAAGTSRVESVDVAQAAAVSVALCQDTDRLAGVSVYTYDVAVEAFVAYCVGRGVLYQFARPGGRAWAYLRDWSLTVEDWLADEGVRHAQEHLGKRHRYTDEALRGHWDCVLIQRGKLQDCWELWAVGSGQLTVDSEETANLQSLGVAEEGMT